MNAEDLKPVDSIKLLMSESRWEEVSSKAEEELANSPERHGLLWIAGWANFQLEQYAKAESYLRRAIVSGPVDHVYYGALGATLSELERYDEAELWLLRA
jgi:Flp pilus assembly protein TadD